MMTIAPGVSFYPVASTSWNIEYCLCEVLKKRGHSDSDANVLAAKLTRSLPYHLYRAVAVVNDHVVLFRRAFAEDPIPVVIFCPTGKKIVADNKGYGDQHTGLLLNRMDGGMPAARKQRVPEAGMRQYLRLLLEGKNL